MGEGLKRAVKAAKATANTSQTEALDIVCIEEDGEWLVWTPDENGGVIGSGDSKEAAILNARCSLIETLRTSLKP